MHIRISTALVKRPLRLILLLATALSSAMPAALLLSCQQQSWQQRPTVTVTIEPLRYMTEQIAGDRATVQTLVPAGSNPETYEPTPQQMARLSASSLYIKVGQLGFETTWLPRLSRQYRQLTVASCDKGMERAAETGQAADPHLWTSPDLAAVMARNICEALTAISPSDSAIFRSNLDHLLDTISTTDKRIAAMLAGHQGERFVIYHPALTHFARRYGLVQIHIEEEGREPSAAQLRRVIDEAQGARVMLVQEEFANRNTDVVAKATGAQVKVINPLSYDWPEEMLRIADALR